MLPGHGLEEGTRQARGCAQARDQPDTIHLERSNEVTDSTTSAQLLPVNLSHISNVTMPAHGLGAVIVGLGRAGMGLHIPVLEKIRHYSPASPFGAVVGLVDTVDGGVRRALHRLEYDFGYDPRRVSCATSLADLPGVDRDNTIVHICTPADDHAPALRAATEAGFRRIIVEKPCASNTADVDEM